MVQRVCECEYLLFHLQGQFRDWPGGGRQRLFRQYLAQQTARLGNGWTAELSGFYTSPSIWQGPLKPMRWATWTQGYKK